MLWTYILPDVVSESRNSKKAAATAFSTPVLARDAVSLTCAALSPDSLDAILAMGGLNSALTRLDGRLPDLAADSTPSARELWRCRRGLETRLRWHGRPMHTSSRRRTDDMSSALDNSTQIHAKQEAATGGGTGW